MVIPSAIEGRVQLSDPRFVIRDDGEGFDAGRIPDPADPKNLLRPSGRGLLLMRSFMDELHFNDIGNEVKMLKRRNPKVDAGLSPTVLRQS